MRTNSPFQEIMKYYDLPFVLHFFKQTHFFSFSLPVYIFAFERLKSKNNKNGCRYNRNNNINNNNKTLILIREMWKLWRPMKEDQRYRKNNEDKLKVESEGKKWDMQQILLNIQKKDRRMSWSQRNLMRRLNNRTLHCRSKASEKNGYLRKNR